MLTGAFRQFHGYDIPPQEVAELYKLYTQTGGPSWIDHTNWFENKQCATWFGLTVAGGRVKEIKLNANNLVGALPGGCLKGFGALTHWNTNNSAGLTGTILLGDIPVGATSVYINNSQIAAQGLLADLPAGIGVFYAHATPSNITGALSDVGALANYLSIYSTSGVVTGGAVPMSNIGVVRLDLYSLAAATTASKDSIIERIYADRALFTNAAHVLNISGGGALTGVYQTSAAPATPAEKAYALVNDPNGEGFLKWAITL